MKSIFTEKQTIPSETSLKIALADNFTLWKTIEKHTKEAYPNYTEEWNYGGEKYGWSYRIKDKKRIIIYFLPRDKFFKVAFVFGEKAVQTVMDSTISEEIKNELQAAKPYAEGRGIRLVSTESNLEDIKRLVEIKISG